MIALDSSAVIGVLNAEPERDALLKSISATEACCISALTLLETRMVVRARFGVAGLAQLAALLAEIGPVIVPFDEKQAELAFMAFERFGKGMGSAARLNLGDCVSYALAKHSGVPLLYKGSDFAATDIEPAR